MLLRSGRGVLCVNQSIGCCYAESMSRQGTTCSTTSWELPGSAALGGRLVFRSFGKVACLFTPPLLRSKSHDNSPIQIDYKIGSVAPFLRYAFLHSTQGNSDCV